MSRLKAIFGSKANQILEGLEDPKASLDYSLTRQQGRCREGPSGKVHGDLLVPKDRSKELAAGCGEPTSGGSNVESER